MQTLIAFLGALTLLIFVHEMGHYLAARYYNVKVLRFSIGFGKPLVNRRIGPDQTEWSIGLIPLGGYVRMVDERDESQSDISARDLPRAFTRQSLWARSVIVAAGPIANFLLAILLYATLGLIGVNEPAAVVAEPPASSPAAAAGLREGDQILGIDGSDIRSWHEVRMKLLEPVIERRSDVRLDIQRAGQPAELTLSTTSLPEGEAERDFMGALGMAIAPGDVLIGGVLEDSASSRAGLLAGDRIVRIDDVPVVRARDVINVVKANAEQSIIIDVERGGAMVSLSITPESVSDETAESGRSGRIGAQLRDAVRMELVRHGPLDSLLIGARQTLDMSLFSLRMFGKMIMGELSLLQPERAGHHRRPGRADRQGRLGMPISVSWP
ncbi:MAG: RIP metalloprotease RseP [Burkholderiaceae bacterium]